MLSGGRRRLLGYSRKDGGENAGGFWVSVAIFESIEERNGGGG